MGLYATALQGSAEATVKAAGIQATDAVSDKSYINEAAKQADIVMTHATLDAAIQTALALWKRSSNSSIGGYQSSIAKRQVALAKAAHEHAKEFWPQEQSLLADAFGLGYNDPQYSALSNSWANYVDDAHDAYLKFLKEDLSCYCISMSECEKANWKRNQQKDRAQMIYHADRQAEGRADALNDYRYGLQYTALGLGQDHLNTIPSYWQLAGQNGDDVRDVLIGSIRAAREAYGVYQIPDERYMPPVQVSGSNKDDSGWAGGAVYNAWNEQRQTPFSANYREISR